MSDVGRCPKHDELLEIEMFGTTPLCRSCLRESKQGTPEGLSIKFTREFETDAASPNYQQTKATKWEVGPERAELQVSLLNEIGKQMARNQEFAERMLGSLENRIMEQQHYGVMLAEQAETLKTYKLSLEGIQGLLVEIQATVPLMLGSVENRIMEQRSQLLDNQTSLATRLAQIEERLRTEMEGMRNIVDALGERLEPCKVCAGKRRVHALFERKTLENKAATVDEIMAAHDGRTPRKAGKRPVRKAGKRLKTSKL